MRNRHTRQGPPQPTPIDDADELRRGPVCGSPHAPRAAPSDHAPHIRRHARDALTRHRQSSFAHGLLVPGPRDCFLTSRYGDNTSPEKNRKPAIPLDLTEPRPANAARAARTKLLWRPSRHGSAPTAPVTAADRGKKPVTIYRNKTRFGALVVRMSIMRRSGWSRTIHRRFATETHAIARVMRVTPRSSAPRPATERPPATSRPNIGPAPQPFRPRPPARMPPRHRWLHYAA